MENYRVKYWRWINTEFGEWVTTGLMSKKSADAVADSLLGYHENVTVYEDEQEARMREVHGGKDEV